MNLDETCDFSPNTPVGLILFNQISYLESCNGQWIGLIASNTRLAIIRVPRGGIHEKTSDAGDIITANFLDFPPNLGIFRPFQVILGHFRQF